MNGLSAILRICTMRNYALYQAEISGTLPGSGILSNLVENWRARRALARLDRLDDFMLNDIGISRADIDLALHVPFNQNALVALEIIAGERRASHGRDIHRSVNNSSPATFSAVRAS
jgi:uncharacterized protein YjiS (DUF1127 family)